MEAVGEERVKGGRQEEGERFEGVAMAMEGEKGKIWMWKAKGERKFRVFRKCRGERRKEIKKESRNKRGGEQGGRK